MAKRLVKAAAFMAVAAVSVAVAPPMVAAQEKPVSEQVSLLYSLTGDSATMRLLPGSGNRYAFTLKNPDDRTVWFANRPARHSGTLPTTALITQWAAFGFAADPPNVAITLHEPNGDTDTIVAVMRKPTISKSGTLRATMEVLSTERAQALTGNLARHGDAHDTTVPTSLGSVSVFIDDVNGSFINGCLIQPATSCPGADLLRAYLSHADLSGADLSAAVLAGASMSWAQLPGANLTQAQMGRVSLYGANLSAADLSAATLYGAIATSADLSGANLSGADMRMIDLSWADLSGANLSGANLSFAILAGANLDGANLDGVNLGRATWRDWTTCTLDSVGVCTPLS